MAPSYYFILSSPPLSLLFPSPLSLSFFLLSLSEKARERREGEEREGERGKREGREKEGKIKKKRERRERERGKRERERKRSSPFLPA